MFGRKNAVHFSGHRHGLVDVLWKVMKRQECQGHLLAITIDEHFKSQVTITLLLLIFNKTTDTMYVDLQQLPMHSRAEDHN
jgi:hypothetical protein